MEDDDEYMDVVEEEENKPEVSGNIISCHQFVKLNIMNWKGR